MGLFSTLGGLAGALIPGLGPIIGPALGSGIGSLLDGDSPKKAIRNAVTAGVIGKFASPFLQKTGAGKAISGAFGSAGIGTKTGIEALAAQNAVTQAASSTALQGTGRGLAERAVKDKGFMEGFLSDPVNLLAAGSILGAGIGATKDQDASKPKYFSYHTGSPFDTMEEASAEDRRFEQSKGMTYADGRLPQPTSFQSSGRISGGFGYAQGGFIEGPGTGTSDSVPAEIRQGGVPVQKALLSDGEFVMTEAAVTGAGNGDRKKGAANMYAMMRDFERGQA